MCGIAGIFDPRREPSGRTSEDVLKRMTDAIAHRGPNADGHHLEPHVALGHRRLSIIDVATGQQPLFNEDGSVVVVFNGEIYNFQELVAELEACGHHFHTKSDTEVIVHGWEQWGVACVERFRGMFAFALWDRKAKTFFMARDRMGVKPLYYGFAPDSRIVFGSEIKALLEYPSMSRDLDSLAIEDYLAYGYVPDPRSIYKSIRKLPPAHTFLWKVGDNSPRIAPYWDVDFSKVSAVSEASAIEEMHHILNDAIQMRLISEVPLGAFLSGGVDSSAVVALMAKHSSAPVKTCSIAFDNPLFDESDYASQVARKFSTDHVSRQVTSDDFGLIDTLVKAYDEPFADSSAIPTYRVCELARERVTVALSGDGGDETFAGYRRYKFQMAEERVRALFPDWARKSVFSTLAKIYPNLPNAPRPLRAKSTLTSLSLDSVEGYANSVNFIRQQERYSLYSKSFTKELAGYNAISVLQEHRKNFSGTDPLSLVQYLDYKTYLPGDINVKVDRVSMAHSLEVREPLMDHKLIEWAAKIPSSMKLRNGVGKYILKKGFESELPNEILYRQKMGFAVPISNWFRSSLKSRVQEMSTRGPLVDGGVFDQSAVKSIVDDHLDGKRDRSMAIWTLLMFDGFLRNQ
jgi:asparagine synthase (glutamine-hydrolysing)